MTKHDDHFTSTFDQAQIHTISSKEYDPKLTPILFVPGFLGLADSYQEQISLFYPRRVIAFSPRGLGRSNLPSGVGAGFEARSADLDAVGASLSNYFLCAFSAGVGIAVEHAVRNPDKVAGIILMDYEPVYRKASAQLLDTFKANSDPMRPFASVERYFLDSSPRDLYDLLPLVQCPVMVEKGGLDGSLLPWEAADKMVSLCQKGELVVLPYSSHEVSAFDRGFWTRSVKRFMARNEQNQKDQAELVASSLFSDLPYLSDEVGFF